MHKQNTHGIYEEGGIPIKNPQVTCASDLLTSNNSAIQSGNMISTQSNLSPNTCLTNQNGLVNQNATVNPLLSVYDSGLSKEQQQQLQQIHMQIKNNQLFNIKNVNNNSSVNYPQQSNTPLSFINNSNSNATSNLNTHQTLSPNSNNGRSMDRNNERDAFNLQGIDPSDTTNRYFNQYTEICPHCKRRFKSIKWLKTHVSNEHPNLIPSNLSSPNLSNTQNSNDKQSTDSNASNKIKCIFCTKMFSDQESHYSHLFIDHKSSLEEIALAQKIDYASHFGKCFLLDN